MKHWLFGTMLLAGIIASVWMVGTSIRGNDSTAQGSTTLGVDTDPLGNSPTSLGSIQACRSVGLNDSFDIDIYVENIERLLGWEIWFVYDEMILTVSDADVQMFQSANPDSNVFNASETTPDSDGIFVAAAADLGGDSSDSGTGVLARLTLRAVGTGLSPASLPQLDIDDDGTPDVGTLLTDDDGTPIGDVTGDRLFDGPTFPAQIAVDTPCPDSLPTPILPPLATPSADSSPLATAGPGLDETPATQGSPTTSATVVTDEDTPSDDTPSSSSSNGEAGDGDGTPIWVLGPIIAALLVMAAAAFAIVVWRRRGS